MPFPVQNASTVIRTHGKEKSGHDSRYVSGTPGFLGNIQWGDFFLSSALKELFANIPSFSFWYTPRIPCDSKQTLDSNKVLRRKKEKEKERERDGGMERGSQQFTSSHGLF